MQSLVYVHPKGQFLSADTIDKMQVELGSETFTNIIYEVTYSLPKPQKSIDFKSFQKANLRKQKDLGCTNELNYNLDMCIIDVSKVFSWLYLLFQSSDILGYG